MSVHCFLWPMPTSVDHLHRILWLHFHARLQVNLALKQMSMKAAAPATRATALRRDRLLTRERHRFEFRAHLLSSKLPATFQVRFVVVTALLHRFPSRLNSPAARHQASWGVLWYTKKDSESTSRFPHLPRPIVGVSAFVMSWWIDVMICLQIAYSEVKEELAHFVFLLNTKPCP